MNAACLALGHQLEESPGPLEFVYLSSGAPVLPKAPDPATKGEGRCQAATSMVAPPLVSGQQASEKAGLFCLLICVLEKL